MLGNPPRVFDGDDDLVRALAAGVLIGEAAELERELVGRAGGRGRASRHAVDQARRHHGRRVCEVGRRHDDLVGLTAVHAAVAGGQAAVDEMSRGSTGVEPGGG